MGTADVPYSRYQHSCNAMRVRFEEVKCSRESFSQ